MKVVYVSYDGALDPLGSSQVRPYLEGLAGRGVALSLVSFEKPARWLVGGFALEYRSQIRDRPRRVVAAVVQMGEQ